MFERMMKGGPVKERAVEAVQLDTPGETGDAVPRGRGFVRGYSGRLGAKKPEDVEQPEGWKMGPIARMGARLLREPGLRDRGF
jgi:hypothetical protein